jgi:hypothetical protein
MLRLRVGQRLVSATDTTAVIVIKASADEILLTCGGAAMAAELESAGADGPSLAPPEDHDHGTLLGRRYESANGAVELLCTQAGTASLAVNDVPMTIKAVKALPASD